MDIPGSLLHEVVQGKVVVFLGAGASLGSKNSENEDLPSTSGLVKLISDRFLSGKYKEESLTYINELAISESDLITVQDYLKIFFGDISQLTSI